MDDSLHQHLAKLRRALLSLPATGEEGFEGLIGVALGEISGVPFRLAASGSQFGVDGKPTYEADAICFEGKRYENSVPRNEVLSKIAELSISDCETDIWVLGATSQIGSQLADDARALGTKNGIVVLILDWSEIDLPPFAVALTMGGMRVHEFLKRRISDDKTLHDALTALEAVKNSPGIGSHADRISADCKEPASGWTLAQKANTAWLIDAFSSRKRAKTKLGQPLSPGDMGNATIRQRKALIDSLHPYLSATPDGRVVWVIGSEGHGKSWIVAQSWLALGHKPLMVFMTPDDFGETAGQNEALDLLISKLIKQTGDIDSPSAKERWRRRLAQWRSHRASNGPRLVAVIDGVNQRPQFDWARIVERIGDQLSELGGRLIVTSRTQYFKDRVRARLSDLFAEVVVPEWTDVERDEILLEYGIKASDMHPDVAVSLRNPRLLGIALELLNKADIASFEELTVSRLLFEHMRMSERDAPAPQPAIEFARRLQKHAQEIMSRADARQKEDLYVFEGDVGAVADGRFFREVAGDPTRYSLEDEGLTLALGFAVIDRLRIAKRNCCSLDAELEAILEPISGLDDTADVVIAASTVAIVGEQDELDITTALIKGFATLQNPDQSKFPALTGLAKRRPQGFLRGARELTLAGGRQPNFDWIRGALVVAARTSNVWPEMSHEVHRWLSVCSLSPERGIFSRRGRDSDGEVLKEIEENRTKIKEKLDSLSSCERTVLGALSEEEGDLSALSRLALLLLAGKPLKPFAPSLLNCCFSFALNSDHHAPHKELGQLVSLNTTDWSQTRAALLEISRELRGTEVSGTGKWTLVNILRATGHSQDGKEAESLVEELTRDWRKIGPWRLVENYCASDPCDPASEQPSNIDPTADKYAAIDVGKLYQLRDQSSESLFFDLARPAMARFKPEVAVFKHREFATDVVKRTGLPLSLGLFELRQHTSLLTIEDVNEIVKRRAGAQGAVAENDRPKSDSWIVSQYQLLLSFPFLTAREQTEALLSADDDVVILDLMELAKPLAEADFETFLKTACYENNQRKQILLLELAKATSVKLSADVRSRIAELFRLGPERERILALAVIAQTGDEELLDVVAKSDWNARGAENGNNFETWFGSIVLLEAATRGLLAHDEALNRISAQLYGWAVTRLDADAVREIARRIDASIDRVAGLESGLVAPDIEMAIDSTTPFEPIRPSINERRTEEAKDVKEAMERLSETDEAFERRQNAILDAFHRFKTNLTDAEAGIILDRLSLKEFAIVADTAEDLADRWYRLFMGIDDTKLPAVHNLVVLLAHALSNRVPNKSDELFRRVEGITPLVRFTLGKAGVQLSAVAIWRCVRTPVLDRLRFKRLDSAGTDHDLSLEVLAAFLSGQQELLALYVDEKIRKEEPAEICRGIMVAGLSDQSQLNDEVLKRFEGSGGLIGSAQKAARYAYERNVWARDWFKRMCEANNNIDFWRCAVLFLKIVDGRFDIWRSNYREDDGPIRLFGPAIKSELEGRLGRWKDHRSKKLFGLEAPGAVFIKGAE